MNKIKQQFQYGESTVTMETGEIARQADGAVLVDVDGTMVLVTVVCDKDNSHKKDFFPLTINYQERTYAAGKIPGGFFRREGRSSEKETLTSRLIDRPLRPLFPKGFTNETQIVATVLSLNVEIDPDIPSLLGASAAMAISGIPFEEALGAARVGYIDGEYILNPKNSQLAQSKLDLVVAGTKNAVLMVESEADQLTEEIMLGAVVFGHDQARIAIDAINKLADAVAAKKMEWQAPAKDETVTNKIREIGFDDILNAYQIAEKLTRQERLSEVRKSIVERLCGEGEDSLDAGEVMDAIEVLEKKTVRDRIIAGELRIDGRDTSTVRQISVRTGVLPRTHGSALFTRGETQALVVTTLGTAKEAQVIDALEGERRDPFMLHYNFPPYCVGEVGRVGTPKRREIGHGRLARRGIQAMLPTLEEFPYTIRVVSEVTESNGSSSMATICGSSLSMMDAGVPVKAPVAGIAMGLIKEEDKFAVLTDIMGDEDHLGDMDFKVAGTREGINALQMDIKINGITREIMETALLQAKDARIHILNEMDALISVPREEMSEYAPRIVTFSIDPGKIRDVIGKGGVTIRAITEETGVDIDISDDGVVKISSVEKSASDEARSRIELITADVEVGKVYEGRVAKLMDFGAFVTVLPGKDGLVHISQICEERVQNVSDKLSEGDIIKVKVLEIDKQGRIRLSMKAVED